MQLLLPEKGDVYKGLGSGQHRQQAQKQHLRQRIYNLSLLPCVFQLCKMVKKKQCSPDAVCEEIAALLKSYGLARCFSDKYSGDWVASRLRAHGITVEFNDKTASQLYLEFMPVLNSGRAQLLDNPRLIAQLAALERRNSRASGGNRACGVRGPAAVENRRVDNRNGEAPPCQGRTRRVPAFRSVSGPRRNLLRTGGWGEKRDCAF